MRGFSSHVDGYNDVADQMVHDLQQRAHECLRRCREEWYAISDVSQALEWRRQAKQRFLEAIGGLPEERTPLQPVSGGVLDRGDYRIEKLAFQSLPGYYVTANLYVPAHLAGPAPAILFLCGHSELGKAEPRYQAGCLELVRNGFVVLIFDPAGQGERWQYVDARTRRRLVGGCTAEHSYVGLQFWLAGASVARHFIWDAIRAVDYLCARPEVDGSRIGVTGNSGGGTQTCLLMMVEERLACAAPCCFVMTLGSYMKTGQAQDAEQLVPGAMRWGPDYYEYLAAMAPKPVLVGAALYDFFPIEGTREAVERARHIYRLYGAQDNIALFAAAHTHGFFAPLRQAVPEWMCLHLQGTEARRLDCEAEALPPQELNVTAEGQVLLAFPDACPLWRLNAEWLERQGQPQPPREPAKQRQLLWHVLGLEGLEPSAPLDARVVLDEVIGGYRTEHIFFFTVPDVVVTGVMIHPNCEHPGETLLVLLENGTSDIEEEKPRLRALLEEGKRLFVFDPRGMGAVAARPVNPAGILGEHGTEYKLSGDALLLGTSTLGLRVFDTLRGFSYLRTRPDAGSGKLGLYGVGFGALVGYLAAALDGQLASVELHDMLYSFWALATCPLYERSLYGGRYALWGVLRHLDLPQLLLCLAPAQVRLVNLRDPLGRVVGPDVVREGFLAGANGYLPQGWRPRILLPQELVLE